MTQLFISFKGSQTSKEEALEYPARGKTTRLRKQHVQPVFTGTCAADFTHLLMCSAFFLL